MTRKIPIISFEDLEAKAKKPLMMKTLVRSISEGINDNLEEAINYFAKMKQLPKKEFLKLFLVTEVK